LLAGTETLNPKKAISQATQPSNLPGQATEMFSFIRNSYFPHAIYSLAITSISVHLVSQKRKIAEDRARVAARISILESMIEQLRENKDVPLDELDRLHRLAQPPVAGGNAGESKGISWREVFLGPRKAADSEMNDFDRRDWEKSMSLLLIIRFLSNLTKCHSERRARQSRVIDPFHVSFWAVLVPLTCI